MTDVEKSYPMEANLGRDCLYWSLGGFGTACCYPKAELEHRRGCEGIVDDVCLFVKDGRRPSSLNQEQMDEIKNRAPDLWDKSYLPPGNTT